MDTELKQMLELILINQKKIMDALKIAPDDINQEKFWEDLKKNYKSHKKWED